jgi:hypothetical protein
MRMAESSAGADTRRLVFFANGSNDRNPVFLRTKGSSTYRIAGYQTVRPFGT